MFKNPKTVEIIMKAIIDVAGRNKINLKEFSFGEDFAHIHLEVNVPPTLSIAQIVQFLKGYSSYIVFKEMPNHRLRYTRARFGVRVTTVVALVLKQRKQCEIT
jgi:REP element-mobilizing transposase RayT